MRSSGVVEVRVARDGECFGPVVQVKVCENVRDLYEEVKYLGRF